MPFKEKSDECLQSHDPRGRAASRTGIVPARPDCRRPVWPLGRVDPDATDMEMKVEIDLTKNGKGELAGTFANLHKA